MEIRHRQSSWEWDISLEIDFLFEKLSSGWDDSWETKWVWTNSWKLQLCCCTLEEEIIADVIAALWSYYNRVLVPTIICLQSYTKSTEWNWFSRKKERKKSFDHTFLLAKKRQEKSCVLSDFFLKDSLVLTIQFATRSIWKSPSQSVSLRW